jgi:hypothetical protein
MVGENDGTDGLPSAYSAPHAIINASGNISWAMWGNDIYSQTAVVANRWYHCIWTYSGGTTGRKMFLDGVEQTFSTAQTNALNMVNSTSRLTIAIYPHDLTTSSLNGSISNFKLYNVALTAEEVAAEYALGRTGKALNITDTAVCIGGTVPRAQLDVRGSARFGNVGINTSPAGNLHVRDSRGNETPATIILQPSSNQYNRGYAKIEGFNDASLGAGTGLRFYTRQDSGSDFAVDSLVYERMRISNAGNVGIGTESPDTRLHVDGSLNFINPWSGASSVTKAAGTSSTYFTIIPTNTLTNYARYMVLITWDPTSPTLNIPYHTEATFLYSCVGTNSTGPQYNEQVLLTSSHAPNGLNQTITVRQKMGLSITTSGLEMKTASNYSNGTFTAFWYRIG